MYDLKKHLGDFTAAKWNEWKASVATDVVYEEIATRARVKGADDYIKLLQSWKRAFPDIKVTVHNMVTAGDKIFAEVEWEGTQSGPLEGPFGSIAPSNKRGTLRAAMIGTVKNDKLVELHHYFDMMTLLANIGVAPIAGVPAPGAKAGAAGAVRHR